MIFALTQRLAPQHLLSRLIGALSNSQNRLIRRAGIGLVRSFYDIDLSEAERSNPADYVSFNDFFTRALIPGARPLAGELCSPADGKVACAGAIEAGTMIQSKNHNYSISALIAEKDTGDYENGSFLTVYLAPHNYHRVHMPCDATLIKAVYVPGELFSVSTRAALEIPGLFARNERLVCHFDSANGPMVIVLVGAMLVAAIQPVWMDRPYTPKLAVTTDMKMAFRQGDELGRFQMGSTAIVVLPDQHRFSVAEGDLVRYGQAIV